MRGALRFPFVLSCALVATAPSAAAQQARAALTRDSVNVGDIVGVAVEVMVPAGTELVTADTLQVSGDIENAAHRRVRIDTLDGGGLRYLITYPIAAWKPGTYPLPRLSATLQTGGQQRTIEVTPPQLTVAYVLGI